MSGVIAIVGRPNVGKSALFNRIAGRRIAIVHDEPGVTRDRVTAEVEWRGRPYTLIDTGGIGLRRGEKAVDLITQAALEQVELAIESAHVVLFVVNVQEGLVPLDEEVATRLRQAGKPVLLAVNKADNEGIAEGAVDFSRLGFEREYPVSAIHGRGIEALVEASTRLLPEPDAVPVDAETAEDVEGADADPEKRTESRRGSEPVRLAIVGRPNVGKSSLVNALTRSTRVVVSPIPGTTRDAVDVPFEITTEGGSEQYLLVDTAGVRRRRSIDNSIEFFSVKRTEEAIERSDIVLFLLDAADGIHQQDKKVGALITEARRACIVVVNKWDLVDEKVREAREVEIARRESGVRKGRGSETLMTTLGEFGEWVQEKLFFLDYAPVIFASAKSGFHLDRLLEAIRYVASQMRQRVPTAVLNRTLRDAVEARQPVSRQGEQLKFYYATQTGGSPPRFMLFVNRADLFERAYEKYLALSLRKAFGFEGCPIVLIPRTRPKTIEPVRRPKAASRGSRPPRSGGAKALPRGRGAAQKRIGPKGAKVIKAKRLSGKARAAARTASNRRRR